MKARISNSNKKIPQYAMYRGDTFLDLGTAEQLAIVFNVTKETIRWYATKTHLRRQEKRKANYNNCLLAIRIEEEEEE